MAVSDSWNYKEIQDFHNRVRALLDNISETSLPDKYIDMPEKALFSEQYAKARVEKWKELGENEFAMFESAIIYKTASMFENLVGANSIKKKQLPTISLEYFARGDIKINGMSLDELADLLIERINGSEGTDFIGFMVTQ